MIKWITIAFVVTVIFAMIAVAITVRVFGN